jgi:hypothetical protein
MIDIVHGNRLEAPTTRRCMAGTMQEARRNQCSCIACMYVTDDTTNIHPNQGPIAATAHEAGCNPKIESYSCVFVEIVTE